jgi:thiol:disulfide interchange protein DsbD
MKKFLKLVLILFSSIFQVTDASAQDPSPITDWRVESKKLAEGRYELSFSVSSTNGWQLYAPDQLIENVPTTVISFPDSSIVQEDNISASRQPQKTESLIFPGQQILFFDSAVTWKTIIRINNDTIPSKLQGILFYTYGRDADTSYNPSTTWPFAVPLQGGYEAASIKVASIDYKNPVNDCGDDGTENAGLLKIFLLGFLGGLIALLTPCVFPMIPVTVTFFTKKAVNKRKGIANGLLYGFFIFLIYVLITIPFHVAGKAISPEIFNKISTNAWLNIAFFVIFVVFALSFFGLYEIGLPAGLANKADSKSGLGNMGGIFFMAGTLAIVSFSCTGPILGSLLVGVANEGAWPLTAGAAGFGLALGLPFALFAMFPHWLQSLPKSGGWMTDVKVILGFLELALAIKFFSNADLVKQWGLLKRELFIALWIIIGVLMVLYLMGKLRFAHSSPVKRFSFTRIAFITLFSAFTVYLLPGLTNSRWADLPLISGFPPPRTYSYYKVEKTNSRLYQPIHNDYAEALRLAKEQNKPVLIDFTGWACVNCRRMEERIWTNKTVDSLMRNAFVVVSLYVDEKNNLPLAEQTVEKLANGEEKAIVSIGDKWATFQTENFGAASQPQYAIISPDQVALTKTKFYTKNAKSFIEWLQCGLDAYQKTKQK